MQMSLSDLQLVHMSHFYFHVSFATSRLELSWCLFHKSVKATAAWGHRHVCLCHIFMSNATNSSFGDLFCKTHCCYCFSPYMCSIFGHLERLQNLWTWTNATSFCPLALLSGELAHCKSDRLLHADLPVLLMSQVGGYANLYAITDYFT